MDDPRESYLALMEKIAKSQIPYIVLSVFLVLDAAILIVGSIDFKECPVEEGVTYYLVMQGILSTSGKLVPVINKKIDSLVFYYFSWLSNAMAIGFLIRGSTIIYPIYKPNFDEENSLYCSKTAYLMGFSYLTIHWILISIFSLVVCLLYCVICYWVMKMESDDDQPQNTQNNTNSDNIDINNLS